MEWANTGGKRKGRKGGVAGPGDELGRAWEGEERAKGGKRGPSGQNENGRRVFFFSFFQILFYFEFLKLSQIQIKFKYSFKYTSLFI